MVTAEMIEDWREIVKPFLSRYLFDLNYEGMGQQDKEDFENDFDKILDLAKAQIMQPTMQWIPFESRPLTEEEKADHPYWEAILSGHLPNNGQMILVSIQDARHEHVQVDEYYDDDGSYLDSDYEIGTEATAWMPLPKPYKVGRNE